MGTLPKHSEVSVESTAAPEAIWKVLTDVTRTGEWSHETISVAWLDGATAAAPGVRFRGANKQGRNRWSRTCEVLDVDAPRTFRFRTVPTWLYRDSSMWTFELTPQAGGTRITQRYDVIKLNPVLDRLFYALLPPHRDRSDALRDDLRRLAAAAEATMPVTG